MMIYSTRIPMLIVLTLLAALEVRAGEAPLPGLEGIPEIVADVDGRPIRRMELVRELVGASGAKALDRLVHRILIEQHAADQKIVVSNEDIELQYKIDKTDLADDLINVEHDPRAPVPMEETIRSKFGVSVEEYKNTIIRQRLLSRRCMALDVNPDDHELRKFFEEYPDLFQEPIRYRAAHILITPLDPRDMGRGGRTQSTVGQMLETERLREERKNHDRDRGITYKDSPVEEINDAWRESKIQAERLSQELQTFPQRWNDYVKRYSRDPADQPAMARRVPGKPATPPKSPRETRGFLPGELGWYHKHGPMVRDFYEGTKTIKVGQIAGPIKTQFGWHIVKMMDVKFPRVLTFTQAKDKIRRLYIENQIQLRSESWFAQLSARADLKTEKASLWPPKEESAERDAPGADPVVGRVNGVAIKRSEIWRDLLRTEGEEALTRLINREVVMTILRERGVAYMEWLCSSPNHRSPNAPRAVPIRIKEEEMQRELNDERVEHDKLIHENPKEFGTMTFSEFVYRKFGQTEAEYRRAVEASSVLRKAIRQKVVPSDET
ncbi:MAG: peptidyl-prolyl cis-trans isomerase, partial [Planctomycetota bacterium]